MLWLGFFAGLALSFFYKTNTLVLRVFAQKIIFFVLRKIQKRDVFHGMATSLCPPVFACAGSASAQSIFSPSRIHPEVYLG